MGWWARITTQSISWGGIKESQCLSRKEQGKQVDTLIQCTAGGGDYDFHLSLLRFCKPSFDKCTEMLHPPLLFLTLPMWSLAVRELYYHGHS